MFCAAEGTSTGLTFGFLGGRLWGLGRLLAPPTASLEPHRQTHIKKTTANMQRHTPAILALTLLHSIIRIIAQLSVFLLPFVSQIIFLFSIGFSDPWLSVYYSLSALLNLKKCMDSQKAVDKQCETEDGLLG